MQTVSIETSKHTAAVARKQRSTPLEPQVADRLLDLLSSDDIFRRLFKRNPVRALAQVGFVESASAPSPFGCFFGISRLASKAHVGETRSEIKEMLLRGLSQTAPQLDAAAHTERRSLR